MRAAFSHYWWMDGTGSVEARRIAINCNDDRITANRGRVRSHMNSNTLVLVPFS